MLNIYSKDFHPLTDIEENLFNEVWYNLNDAVRKGIGQSDSGNPDADFIDALRHSNAVFAAFKVHRVQNDMARLLLDSDGNLKPFEQWSNEVMPIASHQMGTWLRTEYDTAVIRAHQAADWCQFEREKDILPNLEWIPSTSPNPGEDHRIFWGIVRPVDDPFWSEHRPGDRWNCKCSLRSTDEPVTSLPAITSTVDFPQAGLDCNPGTTRQIFSDDHPYFPKDCSVCPFNKGFSDSLMRFFNAKRKKDCFHCRYTDKFSDRRYIAKSEYYRLKHDPDYIEVYFDKKTAGVKATHIGHRNNTGPKEFFNNTMSGADLERACVDQLFHLGRKVILCDESKMMTPDKAYTALDMELDGDMVEIASITQPSRWYSYVLVKKNGQLQKYNARPDVTKPASAVCLYFYDASYFNETYLHRSINRYKHAYKKGKPIEPIIKKLYIVINGRKKILEYSL